MDENTVGKGEIARYEQFLLFSLCFQKTYTADTSKPGLVWERVKVIYKLDYKKNLNPFPNKLLFLHVFSTSPLQNSVEKGEIGKKEKLLVMSNSSFCSQPFLPFHRTFPPFSSDLTHYHAILHFDSLKMYSCGKYCEKSRNGF